MQTSSFNILSVLPNWRQFLVMVLQTLFLIAHIDGGGLLLPAGPGEMTDGSLDPAPRGAQPISVLGRRCSSHLARQRCSSGGRVSYRQALCGRVQDNRTRMGAPWEQVSDMAHGPVCLQLCVHACVYVCGCLWVCPCVCVCVFFV